MTIEVFFHCKRCIAEKPPGQSPREFARLEAGWTPEGVAVRCVRHNKPIISIDFKGQKIGLSRGDD